MSDYQSELENERAMKDQFMAHHAESPFVSGRVHDFSGLAYFPIDERLRLTARLERAPLPQEAYLRTNRDGQAVMRYLGQLVFDLYGETLRLRVYHAGEGVGTSVFIPFRDRTSGAETYGPGRYLTLDLSEDDTYELDFNRAFNPYCAYTDAFECPFPPVENDLPVEIRAGEKVWQGRDLPKVTLRPPTGSPRRGAARRPRKAKDARAATKPKVPSRGAGTATRSARGRAPRPTRRR